jgi:hypothetical protein
VTSTSKSCLSELKVPFDSNYPLRDDSDDESDDGSVDADETEMVLADTYDRESRDDSNLQSWFAGIKRNPLKRARTLVHFLHSSDQCREGFCEFIKLGNEHGWFNGKDNHGKHVKVKVPELQLLRDVKTRWDSVYLMLERLRQLRLVCVLPSGHLRLIEHFV